MKIYKVDDAEGDLISYTLPQASFMDLDKRQELYFDTYFYDDVIKLELFQKNSTLKTNLIGKASINLSLYHLNGPCVIPVEIMSKKLNKIIGIVYFKMVYKPRSLDLFYPDFQLNLR